MSHEIPETTETASDTSNLPLVVRMALVEQALKHEREMRQTIERTDKMALDKAEVFITEKSAEHNNLLKQMAEKDATYVTKKELEDARDKLFSRIISILTITTAIAGILTVYINYLIRTAGK